MFKIKVIALVTFVSLALTFPAAAKAPRYKNEAKAYAKTYMLAKYNWGDAEYACTVKVFEYESHWNYHSNNHGKYLGIPQLNTGAIKGQGYTVREYLADYKIQVRAGLKYIKVRYKTPCGAWKHIQRTRWY